MGCDTPCADRVQASQLNLFCVGCRLVCVHRASFTRVVENALSWVDMSNRFVYEKYIILLLECCCAAPAKQHKYKTEYYVHPLRAVVQQYSSMVVLHYSNIIGARKLWCKMVYSSIMYCCTHRHFRTSVIPLWTGQQL